MEREGEGGREGGRKGGKVGRREGVGRRREGRWMKEWREGEGERRRDEGGAEERKKWV